MGLEVLEFPRTSTTIAVPYSQTGIALSHHAWGRRVGEEQAGASPLLYPPTSTFPSAELDWCGRHPFYLAPSSNPHEPFPPQASVEFRSAARLAGLALHRHEPPPTGTRGTGERFTCYQLSTDGSLFAQHFDLGARGEEDEAGAFAGAPLVEVAGYAEPDISRMPGHQELKSHRPLDVTPVLTYLQHGLRRHAEHVRSEAPVPGLQEAILGAASQGQRAGGKPGTRTVFEMLLSRSDLPALGPLLPCFADAQEQVDAALDRLCAERDSVGVMVVPEALFLAEGWDSSHALDPSAPSWMRELAYKAEDELFMSQNILFPEVRTNHAFGGEVGAEEAEVVRPGGSLLSLAAPYLREPVMLSLAASRLKDHWLSPEEAGGHLDGTGPADANGAGQAAAVAAAAEERRRGSVLDHIQRRMQESKRKSAPSILSSQQPPSQRRSQGGGRESVLLLPSSREGRPSSPKGGPSTSQRPAPRARPPTSQLRLSSQAPASQGPSSQPRRSSVTTPTTKGKGAPSRKRGF
jgi:hypothetical protein